MQSQRLAQRQSLRAVCLALLAIVSFGTTLLAQTGQYASFDAPGAGGGNNQGTFPNSINSQGWIGGTIILTTSVDQGFLRSPNGTYTVVIPTGAAQSTVSAINASHEAVGLAFYANGSTSGFLRDASGNYTRLAVSGAYSTTPSTINDNGMVAGFAFDSTGSHGFVWTAPRGFAVFDVPGSSPGTTYVYGINKAGAVVGSYTDGSYTRGFLRSGNGRFITFEEIPGGTVTAPAAINNQDQMIGWANDGIGGTDGFVRNAGGASATFGIAGAQGSAATAINDNGVIVGWEFSDGGGDAGFERDSAGNLSLITLPFSNTASMATGINVAGKVVGKYTDSNGASHGWVGMP
jgi:hypothetical protein